MNNQEIPAREQAQPVLEQDAPMTEEHIAEKHAQQTTPLPQHERVWPTTPPPFVPSTRGPYTWPMYAPRTGQQWRSDWPSASPSSIRRRSHWPWIVLIIILLVAFVTGGAFFLASNLGYHSGSVSTTTQHYSVSPNPTIVLNNDTGSIHVRAGASSSDVTVQATKHTNWWGNTNDMNVTYNQDREGNTITVNVERPGTSSISGSSSVDFDLTVPGTAVLHLQTHTGSINVSGVSGQLVLTSNTGSVQASGGTLSGNSQLLTNTGSITFSGSIG
ncbi:MAG TPA: hypothetical protein VFB12_05255, partial [Ktedonobacteraceae bacterium]|nr:hypothetical protein [Ktedonobacteraceae bacterium]